MIEVTILKFLQSALPCPVYTERPENPPVQFVLLQRTAGTEKCGIKRATITVHSIAGSMQKAAELNETVQKRMKEIGGSVAACNLNATSNYTDTVRKEYRYQSLFNLMYMEDDYD